MIDSRGGWNRKSIADHIADGTYRRDRHGPIASEMLDYPPRPFCKPRASAKSQQKWVRNGSDEIAVRNGCRFQESRAEHAARFFAKFLRHSKGQWAGEAFELLPWQRDDLIYPLFGWVRPDGRRRFRRTYIQVPKKNGKSTLASGIGLYMLTADGEAGAEVYSVAADRDQASIVHGEAMRMVEASEQLAAVLKLNRASHTMRYLHTNSWYRALSSGANTKEGLNIHCAIIDELHAWKTDELWNTLKYGYRARREPLQFVITTAGDDPESVCYRQYEYAKAVKDGTVKDDSFFTLIYEADPEEDWEDSGLWARCNPSFGVTMDEEGFREDVQEAKRSLTDEIVFKRYSLNIWSTSTNPWLRMDDWHKCAECYTRDDMVGRECAAGLDLSSSEDMTSLVLMFPDEDLEDDNEPGYRQLAWFWLPSESVEKHEHRIDYRPWIAYGWLSVIDGPVLNYSVLRHEIAAICESFKPELLMYDPWGAEQLTGELEDQIGITRVKFQQTISSYAGPTADYERLVIAGKLRHNSNPILTWQAGHVQVKTDTNGNKRPQKPAPRDIRKIDGIVAGIQALAAAQAMPGASVYAGGAVGV